MFCRKVIMNDNNILMGLISFWYKLVFSNCGIRKYYGKWRSRGIKPWASHATCMSLPSSVQRQTRGKDTDGRGWGGSRLVRRGWKGWERGLTWRSNCWRKSWRGKRDDTYSGREWHLKGHEDADSVSRKDLSGGGGGEGGSQRSFYDVKYHFLGGLRPRHQK